MDKPTDHRVTIAIEGISGDEGHVRGNDFQKEIQLLLSLLGKTETKVLGEKEQTIYYRVVDLHHSEPTVVFQARLMRETYDRRGEVFHAVERIIGEVRQGSLTSRVDTSWLHDLRDMTGPVGRTVAGVTISLNGSSLRLDQALRRNINKIIAPEEVFNGALTGMLESINVHGDTNRFWIYPDIGATKIKCEFTLEMREAAINAVGLYVRVQGAIKYKVAAPYPHEITVSELIALPQDDLPSFDDLRGIVKPPTGVSSEEFVRKIRDAV